MSNKISRKLINFIIGYNLLVLLSHKLTDIKKIRKIQNKKIKKLMKLAYNIKFYREKFNKAGLTPDDFCCAEDLAKFPKLTKNELGNGFKMKSIKIQVNTTIGIVTTSGSTVSR